jgi:hypothetical protein
MYSPPTIRAMHEQSRIKAEAIAKERQERLMKLLDAKRQAKAEGKVMAACLNCQTTVYVLPSEKWTSYCEDCKSRGY